MQMCAKVILKQKSILFIQNFLFQVSMKISILGSFSLQYTENMSPPPFFENN